jgi:hypothetical protein
MLEKVAHMSFYLQYILWVDNEGVCKPMILIDLQYFLHWVASEEHDLWKWFLTISSRLLT